MIPEYDADGNLLPGVHSATWQEMETRLAWSPYRQTLLAGLRAALLALRTAGVKRVYIDGSFITRKRFPGDWDGCWETDGLDPTKLDPVLLQFADGCAAQKAKYEGAMYLADDIETLSDRIFLEFFQIDKATGNAKGIIRLDLRRLKL